MKTSKIKRVISKKLAKRLSQADEKTRKELAAVVKRESAEEIARMQAKGFSLVTQLDTGEGVFVREDDVVGLHIQLPSSLYKKLDSECLKQETTKRKLVMAAIEKYLEE